MSQKTLSKRVKYTYGIADLFQSTMNNTGNLMWTFVLTDVLLFSNAQLLLISGISSTLSLFTTFFAGLIVSALPAMKWGRHRSYLMIFPFISAVFFILRYGRFSSNDTLAAWIIVAAVFVGDIAFSLVSVAHASLVSVFTKDPGERGMLAGHRATAVAFASVITSYTTVPLVATLKNYFSEQTSYILMTIIVVTFYIAAMQYTAWMAKDYEGPQAVDEQEPVKDAERPSMKLIVYCIAKNPNLIALMIADICRFCGNLLLTGMLAYYFRYVLQDFGKMATYTLLGGITQTLGAFVSGQLSRLSSKFKIVFGEFAIAAALAGFWFVGYNFIPALICLLIYRFFQGFTFSMFFTLYADCTVYSEWKTGLFVPALTSNMYSISARLGNVLKGWLLPAILIAISFSSSVDPSAASPELRASILNVICWIPAAFRLAGGFVLLLGFRLTPDNLMRYQKEIDERKAASAQ